MELIFNAIYNRAERFANKRTAGLTIVGVLFAIAVALVISSGLLISEIEMIGILLGSLGGVLFFFISVFLLRLLGSRETLSNFKEKFSIATRRNVSIGVGLAFFLFIIFVGGDGTNPWVGAATIFVFAWVASFFYTTPSEAAAIEEAANEIIWEYENSEDEEEYSYEDEEDYEEDYDEEGLDSEADEPNSEQR